MKAKVNKVKITIIEDSILSQDVDAIINETTPNLALPSAWVEKGGKKLADEVFLIGFCDVGAAIISSAGDLPYRHIIHAVGPKWGETSARGQLAKATWRILELAEEHQLKSISIPPIATGSNGYPIENCARTMLQEIIDFTFEPLKYLRTIYICTDSEIGYETFSHELKLQAEKLIEAGDGKVSV